MATTRRQLLAAAVTTGMISVLTSSRSWAGDRPGEAARWVRGQIEIRDAILAREICDLEWVRQASDLNESISVAELVKGLELDKLTRDFRFASNLAEYADVAVPNSILDLLSPSRWFLRIFGLRRGYGLLPHVHNNMVSSHLIVSGEIHVRTHDRVYDLDDAIALRPVVDDAFGPGETVAMSDENENHHWLRASSERAMTLDMAVYDVPGSARRKLKAGKNGTLLVDPTGRRQSDGSVIAPVLSFEESIRKFAS